MVRGPYSKPIPTPTPTNMTSIIRSPSRPPATNVTAQYRRRHPTSGQAIYQATYQAFL